MRVAETDISHDYSTTPATTLNLSARLHGHSTRKFRTVQKIATSQPLVHQQIDASQCQVEQIKTKFSVGSSKKRKISWFVYDNWRWLLNKLCSLFPL